MLATGTTLRRHKILAWLGAGGMGEVHRAHESHLGRHVATRCFRADLSASEYGVATASGSGEGTG
jgi:hypothetical protein